MTHEPGPESESVDDAEPVDAEASEPDDRTLRLNEAAIGDVRREVADAVDDIDRALAKLREVLDTRLPELRFGLDDDGEEGS